MSLENLAKIGSLHAQPADPQEIGKRLEAARRSLADAERTELAPESRFDLAYKAIMHVAIAAVRAKGYRLASAQGHHQTAIQTLPLTLGYDATRTQALDGMRRKRNGIDYEADFVTEAMAA